jgi:hypothetical protein
LKVRADATRLSAAEGDWLNPDPNESAMSLWVVQELAPWLFATLVLFWLAPIVRAARRGDPFLDRAADRLRRIGLCLLFGAPLLAFVRFTGGESSWGYAIAPVVTFKFEFGLAQLLPGLAVLTLAEIFRRGHALADLERHTV